ncbi:hypothetical protein INT46_010568 [Mucor plumbeus]|uniref:Uncharacterized protein n=1 Tax=Mucor plumbeus TaxID=97098 RepID=A0A8H7V100_9FUNG|nr:hypothetical protein INT46_010568 [Mucor plumbeus]
MDFTEYLRILGWILTAAFPLVVVYLTGGPDKEPLLDDIEYENRKRKKALVEKREKKEAEEKKALLEASKEYPKKSNKKKTSKKNKPSSIANATDVMQENKITEQQQQQQQQQQQPRKRNNAKKEEKEDQSKVVVPAVVTKEEKDKKFTKKEKKKAATVVAEKKKSNEEEKKPLLVAAPEKNEEEKEEGVKEIDEHMDPTANYARVMRIKPEEEEEEWEAVPAEDGWSQVKSRRPHTATASSKLSFDRNAAINADQINNNIPGLDKKQRENLARQQKKKQQKAAADALQEERLRKHQKELEKIKIQEFYSSGKGKNTTWGKNGQQQRSSKIPNSTAGINEHGQLIWD